jgi:hypothetical protein
MNKYLIALMIMICILPIAQASLLTFTEGNQDSINKVFKELKANDAQAKVGIFTMDSQGNANGRLSFEFNEVCGKVISYKVFRLDKGDWHTLQDLDPGQADYMIKAEIQPDFCQFGDQTSMGYQIDWLPILNNENFLWNNKVRQDKWAWWNATVGTISSIAVTSTSGYGHSYDNWTMTYSIDFNETQQIWNTTWFNTTTKGPIVIFPFNNQSTNDVVGSHDGTPTGSVWTSAGYSGGGWSFDGVNDNIAIPFTQALNFTSTNQFTFMAWVKVNSYPATFNQIIDTVTAADLNTGWALRFRNTGVLEFRYDKITTTGTFSPTLGTWYHLAVTYNNKNVTLFKDGLVIISSARATDLVFNNNITYIGTLQSNANDLNATLDDVRIYNYALTPDQVWLHAQNKSNVLAASGITVGENWQGNVIATDNITYSPISRSSPFTNTYTCTQPAINTNWLLDLNEGCTMASNTDLGTGNLTIVSPLSPQWLNLGGNLSLNQLSLCSGCKISLRPGNRLVAGQK